MRTLRRSVRNYENFGSFLIFKNPKDLLCVMCAIQCRGGVYEFDAPISSFSKSDNNIVDDYGKCSNFSNFFVSIFTSRLYMNSYKIKQFIE